MRFFFGLILGLLIGGFGGWYVSNSNDALVDEPTPVAAPISTAAPASNRQAQAPDEAQDEAQDQAPAMSSPAYMLVLGEVYDRPAFGAGYAAKLAPLYDEFGGEYIAIGGGVEVLEGDYAPKSFVIGRWPSMAAAQAFWNSEGYDELRRARIDNGWGDFDVLLVPGLPQPITRAPLADGEE